MEIIALFSSLLIFLVIGAPIGVALLLSSVISLSLSGLPINILAERFLGIINSYTLLAVPFFIAGSVIMNRGGVTRNMLDFAYALIGHKVGGTAKVNVLGSLFFSGMSGSATADVASQGRMLIPRMIEEGYDRPFSAGVTAAASIITSIIPPSIVMIIYASVTNISIGGLFFAGVVPGILLFCALLLIVHFLSVRRGYPKGNRQNLRTIWPTLIRALPALIAPILVLGGIRFGIVTPTEAGVAICVYALILGLLFYKEFSFRSLPQVMEECVVATAVPMFVIASSASFGFALSIAGFGFLLNDIITGVTQHPLLFMLLTIAVLGTVGLFLESTAVLLIFVPFFAPIAQNYGINDLQYAIVVIITLMMGTLTPPIGLQSFIAADIAKINIIQVDIWYFIAAIVAVAVPAIFFPQLTTFLPTLLM